MLRQAEIHIPPGNKNHIISQILSLYLCLLHNDNIGLENIKHCLDEERNGVLAT